MIVNTILEKKRLFKQKLVVYIQIKTLETSKAPAKSQPAKAANGKANPGKKAAPQSQGKKTGAQEKKPSLVPPTDTSPSSRPGSGVVRHPPIPGKESLSQDSAQYYRVSHGRSNLVGSHIIIPDKEGWVIIHVSEFSSLFIFSHFIVSVELVYDLP